MTNSFRRAIWFTCCVIGALSILSGHGLAQHQAQTKLEANTKTFDLNLFEQNVKKALDGQTIGYSYAINVNGQLKKKGAYGYAVLSQDMPKDGIILDPKGTPQSAEKRMNIASVTKTITATTVVKILQDKLVPGYPALTLDSKVEAFLPKHWKRGPGVAGLTFKELLSQYSGMSETLTIDGKESSGGTSVEWLKLWIEKGVTRQKSDYKYINANLAMFRIIIPYLLASDTQRKAYNDLGAISDGNLNKELSKKYVESVNKLVFQPMGLLNANCKSEGDFLPTRFYNLETPKKNGTLTGDWTETSGGGGWYLSAVDLARFLAHQRYNDKLLTPASRKQMETSYLGWMPASNWPVKGDFGVYYAHKGDLFYGPKDEPRNGMTSCIMNYPNGVQVALLVNSLGTYKRADALLVEAFDNAWILKGKTIEP
ncbi:MAG TPA: serine hydrolase domain-containing protein [Blastocatellia bacterium]|nr:serine hydrolase domain-containing protein [Blastocatellia bacterium]